jgi:hypothetical protein
VPEVEKKTAELVAKGRWSVPGYKVRSPFVSTTALPRIHADAPHRRGSVTCPSCKHHNRDCSSVPFVYSSMVDRRGERKTYVVGESTIYHRPDCVFLLVDSPGYLFTMMMMLSTFIHDAIEDKNNNNANTRSILASINSTSIGPTSKCIIDAELPSDELSSYVGFV